MNINMMNGVYRVDFTNGKAKLVGDALALEYAESWRRQNAGIEPRTIIAVVTLVEPEVFE
ncbi:MAG: hypothetical protein ACYC8W_01855 [Candidatus Tyrphobacter sp.]